MDFGAGESGMVTRRPIRDITRTIRCTFFKMSVNTIQNTTRKKCTDHDLCFQVSLQICIKRTKHIEQILT